MQRIERITRKGDWSGDAADTITLDETGRHRRRIRLTTDGGRAILLDLPETTLLRDGDGLPLPDGGTILVRAAPEALYEVRAANPSPERLLQLAWHLGNRHLPAQIFSDRILIRRDHVIRDMLSGLGASVREIIAPFDPEGGAYGDHGHAHTHDAHSHSHSHSD
ncbi:urease accessory protein UreE [Pararhizobium haloflavum]|uniref:urease accessory protein UreE n=1 Tax=Pararhizobium haloflavum TaxID=2037914 RepID=UPI000C17F76B|nr:urease accessory protein UreE [Pararhizobium haloflavum]